MSMLGIFWICSVVVSYGVGMYLGMYLSKPKPKKFKRKSRSIRKPNTIINGQGRERRIY